MNAYHNVCCPPRSTIAISVKPVGKQILFNFSHANIRVPGDNPILQDDRRDKRIQIWLSKYILDHQAELDAVVRPMGYMYGIIPEEDKKDIVNLDVKYPGCRYCHDPILTIAILGRLSGNIYIPQRELRLTCHSPGLDNTIAFPASYFPHFN